METAQLQTFVALARIGNMTETAKKRFLTQPAVSSQIAALEMELDALLFNRSRKGVTLTEAGRVFLLYARDALMRMESGRSALASLKGLEQGSLSIGGGATATTYLLPSKIGAFHARYPNIRFYVREQASRGVVDAVLSGELDLGIVTLPIQVPRPDQKKIIIQPWSKDELKLIVPQNHKLQKRKSFRWQELDGAQLVLFEAGSAVREHIDQRINDSGIHVDIVMELRSIASIVQMVRQGIGAAFVSKFALGENEGLRCLDGKIGRDLALVYRSDRELSPSANAFLKMM